jgi:Family of unknown function (DUF6345)/Bacterial Ig domain
MKMTGNSVRFGFGVILFSLLLVFCVTGVQASAQDYSACEQIFTNANQLAGVFNCDTFAMPGDPLENRAWLIYPQFLWADFASLPEDFGTAFVQSQDQLQGLTVAKIRLTRFLLTGETVIEFPSSTNTILLDAPIGYTTNQVDSASRSALWTWRQWIAWGEIDANTSPTLSLDVSLADVQDKSAYDAALAAEEAACEEAQAASNLLQAGMGMLMDEGSGGSEEIESIDCSATNAFQVIAITRTVEDSVTVKWNSECNANYRIDFASELSTNTVWQTLYDNYPSHGTTTFWTDQGDWIATPEILHPSKERKRFYRVVKTGTNSAPPQVTITYPTNNVVLSGDVTVSVTATGASDIAGIKLFVDGEEFGSISGDETNFVINTCEWANGSHTLFAVAEDTTGVPTTPSTNNISPQFAASPYVTPTFSNYISRFWFSEPFFEPELGETQHISAVFTTNSAWTLTIFDSSSNIVRTATGTGTRLDFNWNGTGTSNSTLSAGLYDFAISATPTNSGFGPLDEDPTSGTTRRRSHRVRGTVGTFGIAYQGHHPTSGGSFHRPTNGLGGYVNVYHSYLPYGPVGTADAMVEGFASAMTSKGWRMKFKSYNDGLASSYLRKPSKGGTSIFEQVNIGFMVLHGTRGTTPDYTVAASGPLETYWATWHTGATDYDWVRISDCEFGSSTNLRWMASATCSILYADNFWDMWDKVVLPVGDNLHSFLSAHSSMRAHPKLGEIWAKKMNGGFFGIFPPPQTVIQAWYTAGELTQIAVNQEPDCLFAAMYWPACFSDKLRNYSTPDSGDPANISYDAKRVYPPDP